MNDPSCTALRRVLARLLLVAGASSVPHLHAQQPPPDMKLVLLLGQSNMAGRGTVQAQDTQTHPRIYMLHPNASGQLAWTLAKDPMHWDRFNAGVGPGLSFARTFVAEQSHATIGLVPCAVGGTSLDQWMPEAAPVSGTVNLFNTALVRARQATERGRVVALLWHQGEADSNASQISTYPDRLARLVARFRQDLGLPHVPVIAGELGRFFNGAAAFNAGMPRLPSRVPLLDFVVSEGLGHLGDAIHFDSPAQRTYGLRYYAGLADVRTWHSFELEDRPLVATGGSAVTELDPQASHGRWAKLGGSGNGASLTATLRDVPRGSYSLDLRFKRHPGRARIRTTLDGAPFGPLVDQYHTREDFQEVSLGTVNFTTSADHVLRFTLDGRNAKSSGYSGSFDAVVLKPVGTATADRFYEWDKRTLSTQAGSTSVIVDPNGSEERWLKFTGNGPGAYVEGKLHDVPAGHYRITLRQKLYRHRAQFVTSVNGATLGSVVDQSNATETFSEVLLGRTYFASPGAQTIRFTVVGRSAASLVYSLSLDALKLHPE